MGLLNKFLSLFKDRPEVKMVYCPRCFWIRCSDVPTCEGCYHLDNHLETVNLIADSRQRLWELDFETKNGISYDEAINNYITEKKRKEMQWQYF